MLRIATWNIEWFNALFADDGQMLEDDAPSARHGVSRAAQLAGIGIVMAAMDADALLIVEAPDEGRRRSTVRALEGFAETCGLRARRALIGFPSHTEQELALLYDPDRMAVQHAPQEGPGAPRFDAEFEVDLDLDGTPDAVRFARPPLEMAVTLSGGRSFRMIGVHAKSKAPHGARNAAEVWRIGIENRRKQLAQCIWLRHRIEAVLGAGEDLIVLGDLNDGPGLDAFEGLFRRSGVEVVMGLDGPEAARLHDPHARAALLNPLGGGYSTARFFDVATERYFVALLDYIMVSPAIAAEAPRWRIWHPFEDAGCWRAPDLREALLAASDHFPVTLDLPW